PAWTRCRSARLGWSVGRSGSRIARRVRHRRMVAERDVGPVRVHADGFSYVSHSMSSHNVSLSSLVSRSRWPDRGSSFACGGGRTRGGAGGRVGDDEQACAPVSGGATESPGSLVLTRTVRLGP